MDERMLLDAQTGVATYARGLRSAQQSIGDQADLVCDRPDPKDPAPAPFGRPGRWLRAAWPGSRLAAATAGRCVVPDIFRLAQVHFDVWDRPLRVRLQGPPGIAHWSYPLPIEAVGWHNIYTVHDAIPLNAPALTPIDPRRHQRLLTALGSRASAFVTVSEAARAEIINAIIPIVPIVNCGLAILDAPATGALPQGLAPRAYWLVVGAVEIRKNIPAIIEAHRRSGSEWPLVIAGPDGWGSAAIAPLLSGPRIVRMPYLPVDLLRALISQAKALLMVSHAEGFGIPIAEAMALGTPVITADHGAQAEVAGDAALLVDPDRPAAIAAAIQRLTADDRLCEDLADRGRIRARDFAPSRFVDRLRAFYDSIA